MYLTPTEYERLVIFTAAEIARRRKAKGLKLNYPESVALISDEVLEGARSGKRVAELMSAGAEVLTEDDVLPGIAEMMPVIQVEGAFPDGTKLVTIHDPIRRTGKRKRKSEKIPGEYIVREGTIELNGGRPRTTLTVTNTGDRPVQVGSHFHFFEANRYLDFDRQIAFGMHLDVPAGTSVRFEPGESKQIDLVKFGGTGEIVGLNGLTEGSTALEETKATAVAKARHRGFKGA